MTCKPIIIQWNINGINAHIAELRHIIYDFSPYIICIQETLLKENQNHSLSGYDVYRTDGISDRRARGGVATYINKDFTSEEIVLNNTDLEVVLVKIFYPMELYICNLYLPPNLRVTTTEINNIIRQIPGNFLLVGDFNAHSQTWNCKHLDVRGQIIENVITSNDLNIINNQQPTHFNISNGSTSTIDLAICTPRINTLFEFNVLYDLCGSDHFPICIHLVTNDDNIPTKRSKWVLDKADWASFSREVIFDNNILSKNINNIYDHIQEKINLSALQNISKSSELVHKKNVPWWSQEISETIKSRKKALKKFKINPTNENLQSFRKLRAKSRQLIRIKKRESWQKFTSTINANINPSRVWSSIKAICNKKSSQNVNILQINSQNITKVSDIATILGTHFMNISLSSNYSDTFNLHKLDIENNLHLRDSFNDEVYNSEITFAELEHALSTCKGSSPGPDGIPYIMIKKLSNESKSFILTFFNKIWSEQCFPEKWGEALVIPILKPNKNKLKPESYRPISLTNCLCKVMEKIINKRLVWYLETNNILYNNQYGFRKNRSTADNINILEAEIMNAFTNKEELLAVIFDLESAYNLTWRANIIRSFNRIGIKGRIVHFINKFLNNRTFRMILGNYTSESFELENGIPQGSILSVILFLIHINCVSEVNLPEKVKILLYADDIVIFSHNKKPDLLRSKLQIGINNLNSCISKVGLKFNTDKTKAIRFTRRRNPNVIQNLSLNGSNIVFETEIKYLGMWFDTKLSWKPHLVELKTKCMKILNLLRCIASKDWGTNRKTLLQIYNSLIMSRLKYGCFSYSSANKTNIAIITPIHNLGIRIATGAYRTSPVVSILSESGVLPFNFEIERELILFLVKVYSNAYHPLTMYLSESYTQQYLHKNIRSKPGIFRAIETSIKHNFKLNEQPVNISNISFSTKPPWLLPSISVHKNIFKQSKDSLLKSEIVHLFNQFCNRNNTFTHIYTDGSLHKDQIGAGIFSEDINIAVRLPVQFTIYDAELTGIYLALKEIVKLNIQQAIIFTDSRSSLESLTVLYPKHPILTKIQDYLIEFHNNICVKFCWVPSHMGILGNDNADKLANRGRQLLFKDIIDVPMNTTNLKKPLLSTLRQTWNTEWVALTNNKLRHIKPNTFPSFLPHNINRKMSVILTRLRIGHTRLTHEHIFKKETTPTCDECGCIVDIKHIFNICRKYTNIRFKYNITTIADLYNDQNISNCIEFIKEIDIINKI